MLNLFKNIDLNMLKDQITDLNDQVHEMRFQKPWTSGRSTSPVAYMAAGAALTILGVALFSKRAEVARFCTDCGADLKHKWNSLNGKERNSAPTETTEKVS